MRPLADIRLTLWEGGSLWLINARASDQTTPKATDVHSHHALQVSIGQGGRFSLEAEGARHDNGIVAVSPNTPHMFSAEGRVAMLFLEPESRLGRAIRAAHLGRSGTASIDPRLLAPLEPALESAWSPMADDGVIAATGLAAARALALDAVANTPDHRVSKLIAWARDNLDQPITLSDALPVMGVSGGRLRHLFVEHTGLAFKSYLLWLRLHRAVERIVDGASLTQAAHEAGFSDSAHFSRTFRRMFGVPAASLRIS